MRRWYLELLRVGAAPVLHEVILDPTASQFKTKPPYHKGRGRGFLTKGPSKRARALMEKMLWQELKPTAKRSATRRQP